MSSAINTSTSGIKAFQTKMNVIANNVANINTDNFKKNRVFFKEGVDGGVQTKIYKSNTAGHIRKEIEKGQMVEKESSNVDMIEEVTESLPAQRGYEANLKMLKVHDEMLENLLDITG